MAQKEAFSYLGKDRVLVFSDPDSDPDSDEVDEVLSCLEQLSTEDIVTLYWTKNAAFGPVVDGVELIDTPHKLLQQGKIDRTGTLKAVMMGSTSEVRARKKSASSIHLRHFLDGKRAFLPRQDRDKHEETGG
jgi:ABC-type histidine transport system ATPase subunit